MGRLWPSIPLEADESPMSFVSRLARLHGKAARRFCSDLGLGFQAVVNGGRGALERLSDLAEVSLDLLIENAIVRLSRNAYRWRDETFSNAALRRYTLQVCPLCLGEDLARADAGLAQGPYGRATWLIRYLLTCATHHVALVPVSCTFETLHDFSRAIDPFLTALRRGDVPMEKHPPSRLEDYLRSRLARRSPLETPWLNRLGFSAAADTCETVGAVTAFGRTVSMRRLDARALRVAGDMGFMVLSDGPPGIREALAAWDAGTADDRQPGEAMRATYGAFHSFTRLHVGRPELDPVRAVLADHIRWTNPIGPGTVVLGRSVEERYVHSIETATEEYRLDPKLLRRVLRKVGTLAAGSTADASFLFNARAHHGILVEAARSVPGERVWLHLNAGQQQAEHLMRARLIPAWLDDGDEGALFARRYLPEDLDDFVRRLHAVAEPVRDAERGTLQIPIAARHAGCASTDVVRMILDRRLPWVGRLEGVAGFRAIVVRLDDVRALAGPDEPQVSSTQVLVRELRLPHGTVVKLLETGVLPSQVLRTYADGRVFRFVGEEAVSAFRAKYVYLSLLKREWHLPAVTCKKLLRDRGIEPAIPKDRCGTDVYLRSDLS